MPTNSSPDEFQLYAEVASRVMDVTRLLEHSCDEREKLQAALVTANERIAESEKVLADVQSDRDTAGNIITELEERFRDNDAALKLAEERIAEQEHDMESVEEIIAGQKLALKLAEQRIAGQELDLKSAEEIIAGQELALRSIVAQVHESQRSLDQEEDRRLNGELKHAKQIERLEADFVRKLDKMNNEIRLLRQRLRQRSTKNAQLQCANDDLQNRITALSQEQKGKDSDSTDSFGPREVEEELRILQLEAETAKAQLALAADKAKILQEECDDLRKQRDDAHKDVCRTVQVGLTKLRDAAKKEGSSPDGKSSPEEALLMLANNMVDALRKYPGKRTDFEMFYSSGLHNVQDIKVWIKSLH